MPGDARGASGSSLNGAVTRSLKRSSQFRKVFSSGRRFRGRSFRAVYMMNTLGVVRLGFSLSAKSGNSVDRNRFRRRVKSLAREVGSCPGADVVILPQIKLGDTTWHMVQEDFLRLIRELGCSAGFLND
jgi:ribonuclease P protein component